MPFVPPTPQPAEPWVTSPATTRDYGPTGQEPPPAVVEPEPPPQITEPARPLPEPEPPREGA